MSALGLATNRPGRPDITITFMRDSVAPVLLQSRRPLSQCASESGARTEQNRSPGRVMIHTNIKVFFCSNGNNKDAAIAR